MFWTALEHWLFWGIILYAVAMFLKLLSVVIVHSTSSIQKRPRKILLDILGSAVGYAVAAAGWPFYVIALGGIVAAGVLVIGVIIAAIPTIIIGTILVFVIGGLVFVFFVGGLAIHDLFSEQKILD